MTTDTDHARTKGQLRAELLRQLVPTAGAEDDPAIARLADSVTSIAAVQVANTTTGAEGGSLESMVRRALAEVRARVLVAPQVIVQSGGLYDPIRTADAGGAVISADQAALLRQAALIAGNALPVIGNATASGLVSPDEVEALRRNVATLVRDIVAEFGRALEPRPARVAFLLEALERGTREFVELLRDDDPAPEFVSQAKEIRDAAIDVIKETPEALDRAWERFKRYNVVGSVTGDRRNRTFSQRVARVAQLKSVLRSGCAEWVATMDAIGAGIGERQVSYLRNVPPERLLELLESSGSSATDGGERIRISIADFVDWLNEFSTPEVRTDSVEFARVCAEADAIFWVAASGLVEAQVAPATAARVLGDAAVREPLLLIAQQLDMVAAQQ